MGHDIRVDDVWKISEKCITSHDDIVFLTRLVFCLGTPLSAATTVLRSTSAPRIPSQQFLHYPSRVVCHPAGDPTDLRPRCPQVSLLQHIPTPDSHWPFNAICNARVLQHCRHVRRTLHSALIQFRPNVGELLETRAWTLAYQRARSHPSYRAFKPVPTSSLHDTLSSRLFLLKFKEWELGTFGSV